VFQREILRLARDPEKLRDQTTDIFYEIDEGSITVQDDEASLCATLYLACDDNESIAPQLDLKMHFYEDGIVRTLITNPNENPRFRISQEENLVVEDQNLIPVTNLS
jgi:hypothetical protein